MKKWILLILLLVVIAAVAGACGRSSRRQGGEWTPAPVTGSLAIGTRVPELVPPAVEATQLPAQAATPDAILPTRRACG